MDGSRVCVAVVRVEWLSRVFVQTCVLALVVVVGDIVVVVDVIEWEIRKDVFERWRGIHLSILHEESLGSRGRSMRDIGIYKVALYQSIRKKRNTEETEKLEVWHVFFQVFETLHT